MPVDLSKLSDEQLDAYKSLLEKQQPTPPPTGKTGSWSSPVESAMEGAKDAITYPFRSSSYKSLTDNPFVNAFRGSFGDSGQEVLGPQQMQELNRESSDLPYMAGNAAGNALLAGGGRAVLEGGQSLAPSPVHLAEGDVPTPGLGSRISQGVKAAAPDIRRGIVKGGAALVANNLLPSPFSYLMDWELGRPALRNMGAGFRKGMEAFRGPEYGPEIGPKSDVAPAPVTTNPESASSAELPSGVIRIGQTPAERISTLSGSGEGTLGTRAEMMRQLRLADIHGTLNPEKAAIIRRFEAPEYRPRVESEVIAPKPVQ